jgi:hypothetical protein
MRILIVFTAIAALSTTASANEAVANAYYAGVAAQKCGLELSAEQSSLLGDVVQRAEQSSGLAAGDLDGIWKKVNAEADADADGFCGAHKGAVAEAIAQ